MNSVATGSEVEYLLWCIRKSFEQAGRMEVRGFHGMCDDMREIGRLHMKELVEKIKEESE